MPNRRAVRAAPNDHRVGWCVGRVSVRMCAAYKSTTSFCGMIQLRTTVQAQELRADCTTRSTRRYVALLTKFAIANLKHYRTRGIALRWRTQKEVLEGIGQYTCANQRCQWHDAEAPPRLTTLEVPFCYEERVQGVLTKRQALVKVVLCDACAEKLHASRHARSSARV